MKFLYVLCLFSTLALAADIPAHDNADGSRTITLTKEQAQQCDAQDGCLLAPIEAIQQVVQQAIQQAVTHACGKDI